MNNEVIVKKTIQTTPDKVYQAFADGPTWSKWFSENTVVDLKQGGRFSNDDGDTGEILEIVPNERIKFTWEGFKGSQLEISTNAVSGNQTEVTLRHFLLSEETANKMKTCWTWTLDNLASFLEKGTPLSMVEWKAQQVPRLS